MINLLLTGGPIILYYVLERAAKPKDRQYSFTHASLEENVVLSATTPSTSDANPASSDIPAIPSVFLITTRRATFILLLLPHLFSLVPPDMCGGWNNVFLRQRNVGPVERACEDI
jgi:hypothetical protein